MVFRRYSWNPDYSLVWRRGRLQCHGHGPPRPESGRHVQLLQAQIHDKDHANDRRLDDLAIGVLAQ